MKELGHNNVVLEQNSFHQLPLAIASDKNPQDIRIINLKLGVFRIHYKSGKVYIGFAKKNRSYLIIYVLKLEFSYYSSMLNKFDTFVPS